MADQDPLIDATVKYLTTLNESAFSDALGKVLLLTKDLEVEDQLEVAFSILHQAARKESGAQAEKIRKIAAQVDKLSD